jgi:hypothetical protein
MTTKKEKYLGLIKNLNEPARKEKSGEESTKQISAHIPRSLYRKVNVKLAEEDQTLTSLIINLLEEWVKT